MSRFLFPNSSLPSQGYGGSVHVFKGTCAFLSACDGVLVPLCAQLQRAAVIKRQDFMGDNPVLRSSVQRKV